MKVPVSTALIEQYKLSKKNYNYSLSFFLNSLDLKTCKKTMELLNNFQLTGSKQLVEIDEANVTTIASVFGNADTVLIESLLWIAIMLPEI